MTGEVKQALQVLRDNATSDFEQHRIDVLERDLTTPPQVEIVDDKHQRFLGISFRKRKEGHYFTPMLSIYRLVWQYYYGEVPRGTIIHHIDHNKDNNDISNLVPMLPADHRAHHGYGSRNPINDPLNATLICSVCGKTYTAIYTGRNKYCPDCRKEVERKRNNDRNRRKSAEKRKAKLNEPYHGSGIRECAVCKRPYYYDARNSKRKTCSIECEQALRKQVRVDRHRICEVCGKTFEYKKKCQKTCSPECGHVLTAQAIHSRPPQKKLDRVISKCELCGKEIEHLPSQHPRFCSQECVHKYMAKINTKTESASPKEIRTCVVCGKEFEVTKIAAKRWCSPECRQKLHMRTCPICGKNFYSPKRSQVCCSRKCDGQRKSRAWTNKKSH